MATELEKFIKDWCAEQCPKCKAGKPLLVNSAGFYSHSEEGNHCTNDQFLSFVEQWGAESGGR